ncbi:MAG: ROK family protein [Bacteroidetes bacterium]|nr:ROK family protein [Candidatus Colenecus caballi]
MANVIGIDVGGQSSKLGVVNDKGEILAQCVVSSLQDSLSDYLNDLTGAIRGLMSKAQVKGIGIGAPNANYYNGTIEFAPNLRWTYVDGKPTVVEFARLISERTGLPVTLTNDANAAAMGEMAYGVAKGMKNFIMLTLGTGVGSGIVIDGRMVYGHDGFAGELGHVCAVPGGRKCNCGLDGCLETYCSAIGVARTAREMLAGDSRNSLLRQLESPAISSKDVYDAAKQGDAIALEIFQYTGQLLGRALADFVKFSAPEAIILFGGLTKSKEFFHEAMEKSMNASLLKIWQNKVKILYSSLKESDAAILGASALAW